MDILGVLVKKLHSETQSLLEESNSSSSDDEIDYQPKEKHIRVENFVDVCNRYSEKDFKKHFRLNRESCQYMTDIYRNSSYYTERIFGGGRKQITADVEFLSFLWYVVNKTTLREVSNLFGMTISKQWWIIKNIINFMVDISKEVIVFPSTNEEKERIANEFQEISGFPNVLGCIDGSYISVRKPKHKIRSTYANRHNMLSITLQGICDAKCKFLDVFMGVPSKIHDSRVLKLSFIYKDLPRHCYPNYHLLGDSAYSLREYMMTPYRDYGDLTRKETIYNKKFCATRVKIENSFAYLKGRFRQLMRLDLHTVEDMSKIVLACCALHNICIDRGDLPPNDDGDTITTPSDTLQAYLSNEPSDTQQAYLSNESGVREEDLTLLGRIKRKRITHTL